MAIRWNEAYALAMAKSGDTVPPVYPCMMQKDGLRRVHSPHDDYPIPKSHRLRRAITKVITAVR